MKIFITTATLLTLLLLMVTPLLAIVRVDNVPNNTVTTEIQLENFSVKDYQKMMGRKLSLREKIVFRFVKSDLLSQSNSVTKADFIKRANDTDSSFNLGGFLLGFLLSLLGVLIALLFGKNVVKWAWRGFLVSLVVGVIYYLVGKKK